MYKNKFKYIICMVILLSVILLDTNPKVLAATETKAEYAMKKDKEIYKDKAGKIRGVVYFQYPEIKGESKAAKKINEFLVLYDYSELQFIIRLLNDFKKLIG